jgi:hypothetical protein
MRRDALGFFWTDINDKTKKKIDLLKKNDFIEILPGYWVESRIAKDPERDALQYARKLDAAYVEVKGYTEKREPPEPVWLEPDYLPHIEEARRFDISIFSVHEIASAAMERNHELIFDIECYPNYFLVAFYSEKYDRVVYVEMTPDKMLDVDKLRWICENFKLVGFNSRNYDIPIVNIACANADNSDLQLATDMIIGGNMRPNEVLKHFKIKANNNINTVDLIEVAPLMASLKIYSGRLHSKRMQDLPFPPGSVLSADQITCVRWYCVNDLRNTLDLRNKLNEQIELRETMSLEQGLDLRSKSDAQIAEAIISKQIMKRNGGRYIKRPDIPEGTVYFYKVPSFIKFYSPLMQDVLHTVAMSPFVVNEYGKVGLPDSLREKHIQIGATEYTMGIGGLHSCEKKTMHYADKNHILVDRDVTSYYPAIILNLGLYPQHLGPDFLHVYKSIVDRRIAAKVAGDKVVADSLKITINGSFGKFGNRYSSLYSPDLLIQTTITGQLSLLMLIEYLESAGITVVSANTDGLVIKCHRSKEDLMDQIVKYWEGVTRFNTEATYYDALLSRDVNNYIAVKKDAKTEDDIKTKGAYSRPGLSKNPTGEICIDAIEQLLLTGATIESTIRSCTDIRKFVVVRSVKGGAVKDGEYLGKAIRWYYSSKAEGEIVYALSGNKVPKSDGAKPLMDLPDQLPNDIDFERYEKDTFKMLKDCGYPV